MKRVNQPYVALKLDSPTFYGSGHHIVRTELASAGLCLMIVCVTERQMIRALAFEREEGWVGGREGGREGETSNASFSAC